MNRLGYINNCVSWPSKDVNASGGLCDMIDSAREVKRETFVSHVSRNCLQSLEASLGYATGSAKRNRDMKMKDDYHVRYFRSKLHGKRAYFFIHSAIEYVFV